MMRVEPREEDPKANIVLRSGMTTSEDKGKQPEEIKWVHKAPGKEIGFDLERVKETFMEAKKGFVEASTSGSQDKLAEEVDPSMLIIFLETYMKLLHDSKVVKGLQELINKCTRKENARIFRKIGKHKARTGHETRLTVQIQEYEKDQVILDLGLDANVLPKYTWERMGRPALQWSPIQLIMKNQ